MSKPLKIYLPFYFDFLKNKNYWNINQFIYQIFAFAKSLRPNNLRLKYIAEEPFSFMVERVSLSIAPTHTKIFIPIFVQHSSKNTFYQIGSHLYQS